MQIVRKFKEDDCSVLSNDSALKICPLGAKIHINRIIESSNEVLCQKVLEAIGYNVHAESVRTAINTIEEF